MRIQRAIKIPETINNHQYRFKVTAWGMKPGDSVKVMSKKDVHAMTRALVRLEKKPVTRTLLNKKGWRVWATSKGNYSENIIKSKRDTKSRQPAESRGRGRT